MLVKDWYSMKLITEVNSVEELLPLLKKWNIALFGSPEEPVIFVAKKPSAFQQR